MKQKALSLLCLLLMSVSFTSCYDDGYYYEPTWHYNCYAVYDSWGYYLWDECYWEYYNTDKALVASGTNVVTEKAQKEAIELEVLSNFYATEFNLSSESSLKLAKSFKDYQALSSRTEADLADFAQDLYGTDPVALTTAISKAQGKDADYTALESEISKAADVFGTDAGNMKNIVKHFYGKTLKAYDINL